MPHDYLKPYQDAVRRLGAGFEATLWASRDAQRRRFDVIIDLAGLEGRGVLDVGCGPGDLAVRLHERRVAFDRYVGVDALPEMIETARGRRLDRCSFEVRDVLTDPKGFRLTGPGADGDAPDVVCVSGTLNTMDEAQARQLIERAFEASRRAVVFNFLSSRHHARWAGRDLTPAHRFDPVRWLEWSFARTSRVSFTQAYMDGHDATVMLERD
jgi:SAM-dependent methyltransferase